MAKYSLNVNGKEASVDAAGERSLLDVLREDLALTGAKYGCGEGSCRACAVLVDGRPVASCQVPVEDAAGKTIVTIEGLTPEDGLHPVQQAFVDADAAQCGYCVPGMIVTAVALLENNPSPTRDEIVTFMNGNICRCCNYENLVSAVERAAQSALVGRRS